MSGPAGCQAQAPSPAALLAEEKLRAPERWRRISVWRPLQRLVLAAEPTFVSLPLCDLLAAEACQAAPRSLAEAEELASLAVRFADKLERRTLESGRIPASLVKDGQAQAGAAQALIALAVGDVERADQLQLLAELVADEGSGDAHLGLELAVASWAVAASKPTPAPGGRGLTSALRAAEDLGEQRARHRLLFLKAWSQARRGELEPRLLDRLEAAESTQLAGALASLRLAQGLDLGDGFEALTARLSGASDPLERGAGLALVALAEIEQGKRQEVLEGLSVGLFGLAERDLYAAAGFYGLAAAAAMARRGEADLLAALLAAFPLEPVYFAGAPRLAFLAEAFSWWAGAGRPLGPEALAALGGRFETISRTLPAAHPLVMALLAPGKAGKGSKDLEA